ncbi:MAG: thioredoxin family protein [Prevotella sp.]|nr:thioredoxin family protein [Prevotella sp.]
MRKTILLVAMLLFLVLHAQGQGMQFEPQGTLFKDAVAKAQQTGKKIFLDCYTSWCGPCKMMARDVFPQEKVGAFMNPSYVNIQIDMEKGEGPELAKKLEVSAYPTFIIFNSNGQELGRFLGGSNADEFIKRVGDHSIDKGSDVMDQRWNNGDRSEAFLYQYLETLSSTYKHNQCNLVAEALLKGKAETFAGDDKLRNVFMQYLTNPLDPAFVYTAKHPEALKAALGENAVNMKLFRGWSNFGRDLINEEGGKVWLDKERFDKWVSLMEECQVNGRDSYRLNTLIKLAERQKDWRAYVDYCKECCKNPSVDVTDLELLKWMTPLTKECQDADIKKEAAALLQQRYDDIQSGKRQAQTRAGAMTMSGNLTAVMPRIIAVLKGEKVDFGRP